MTNLFENAKFGKAYKTREGRKAIFATDDLTGVYLYLEGYKSAIPYNYDGTPRNYTSRHADIMGEWNEPIDDAELNRIAEEATINDLGYDYDEYDYTDHSGQNAWWLAHKAGVMSGYRAALEYLEKPKTIKLC